MQKLPAFKKILVPVDGSIQSLFAQELTVFIAKKFNSKVSVIHVVSHEFMNPQLQKLFPDRHEHYPIGASVGAPTTYRHVSEPPTYLPEAVSEEINNVYHEKGKEAIESAVALFQKEGIPVSEKLVQHAHPAETILNELEKGDYDLVVMGRSEEEKDPHLGSVAKKVSLHANVPVLIAREKRHILKILAPIDGSKSAEKALHQAALLAKKTDSKTTLLYVQESIISDLKPEAIGALGNRILSTAANQVKGIKIDKKLESGDPAKVIVQTADKGDYDLIVIGSRGLGTMRRFLLGSVSDHVTQYANRSVLIVK